jgi:uncharacterized repeat protein (TIGR02543 family)
MEEVLQPKIITFESNGGSYVKPQIIYRDEKISAPQPPSMGNYIFGNWYTDNISFTAEWNFNDIPEKDITLYAKWLVKDNNPNNQSDVSFSSIAEFDKYMQSLSPNNNPYNIKIDIDDLTDIAKIINKHPDILINLTLEGSNINSIGQSDFCNCNSLVSVTMSDGVAKIDVNAFNNCMNLTEITIPESVTFIGEFSFLNCDKITKVTFKGNIHWGNFRDFSFPGDLMNKYYEYEPMNGTPGTYVRADSASQTWTKL